MKNTETKNQDVIFTDKVKSIDEKVILTSFHVTEFKNQDWFISYNGKYETFKFKFVIRKDGAKIYFIFVPKLMGKKRIPNVFTFGSDAYDNVEELIETNTELLIDEMKAFYNMYQESRAQVLHSLSGTSINASIETKLSAIILRDELTNILNGNTEA